jgi:hypothetical protein
MNFPLDTNVIFAEKGVRKHGSEVAREDGKITGPGISSLGSGIPNVQPK